MRWPTLAGALIVSLAPFAFGNGMSRMPRDNGTNGNNGQDTTLHDGENGRNGYWNGNGEAASQLSLDILGGISFGIGNETRAWNPGFDVSADAFIYAFERLGLGLRFAFNQWSPDEDAFGISGGTVTDVDGHTNLFEIIPSARVRTFFPGSPLNVFGQAGFGLYVLKQTATVDGTVGGVPFSAEASDDSWLGRWGFSLGAGITAGPWRHVSFEILPIYNIVFTGDNHDFQYITANAGVNIEF